MGCEGGGGEVGDGGGGGEMVMGVLEGQEGKQTKRPIMRAQLPVWITCGDAAPGWGGTLEQIGE